MQQQSKPPDEPLGFRNSFDLLYVAATAHSRCVTVFLRDRVGSEANGVPGLLAFIGMFVYGGLMHADEMLGYIGVWILFLLVQRQDSWRHRRRGMVIHSHYAGRPQVALLVAPFVKNEGTAKLFVEPVICLAAGGLLCLWSEPVGKFVAWAGLSVIIVELIDRQIRWRREQAVIDARLEMENLNDRVRSRFGN